MKSVTNTLKRLAKRLFEDATAADAFIESLMQPAEYPVGIVWMNDTVQAEFCDANFQTSAKPGWMPSYADMVTFDQRPGRHQLHDQGAYYCLDPSSVFMASGLSLIDKAETMLDVCASPGGKSILAWRALRPKQLFSNEVIGKRIPALISNLKRCQVAPATVVSIDTKYLAEQAIAAADVVLVDAPCSGQSLIARGKDSPGCFHPATINMNANRQRRILSNAAATVRPGGWLVYMTCTYSFKENERNVEWFLKKNPAFQTVEVPAVAEYRSHLSDQFCYRMWPASQIGAGGFMTVLRRDDHTATSASGSLDSLPVRWQSDGQ